MELDRTSPRAGRNDPEAKEKNDKRRAAQRQLEADTREMLGDERYAQLERGRDGAYQQFHDLTEVFDLSENLADTAWGMRKSALETASVIRTDASLTLPEKREALRGIQQATRNALSGLLSDEYFQAYERKVGDWISGLTRLRN